MKPIDPRLLRYTRATRFFLVAVVTLGAVGAGLVIAQAMLIAEVVVGAFQHGLDLAELGTPVMLLACVAVGRALVGWLTELAAHRASAAVKSELRGRLLERATALGPGWLTGQRARGCFHAAARDLYSCAFVRDGRTSWAYWTGSGTAHVAAPAGAREVVKATGQSTPTIPGQRIRVRPVPVWVTH